VTNPFLANNAAPAGAVWTGAAGAALFARNGLVTMDSYVDVNGET
jgi:hypothetical protein